MQRDHLTHCLVGVAVAAGVLLLLGVRAGTLLSLGVALACPLMMVLMMRGMMAAGGHGAHPGGQPEPTTDPTEQAR